MGRVMPVYRAIEFIEKNLQQEIAVVDVAESVSYSLYHFCRVFSQVVQHSPYDYLMRRRLSESARELITTDKKITDIALDYQFNSPETFSRAFKRMFDMQPNQYKKQGFVDERFLLPALTPDYLRHINNGDNLKPVFAQKPAIRLAGVTAQVSDDSPEVIAQLWQVLKHTLAHVDMPLHIDMRSPGNYYGVSWYAPMGNDDKFFYMAAVEIKTPEITNPALVTKTIPALTCARFIHQGAWQTRRLTLNYIYQTWLPKSGKELAYPAYPLEIECYGQSVDTLDSPDTQWKIYIPIQ